MLISAISFDIVLVPMIRRDCTRYIASSVNTSVRMIKFGLRKDISIDKLIT